MTWRRYGTNLAWLILIHGLSLGVLAGLFHVPHYLVGGVFRWFTSIAVYPFVWVPVLGGLCVISLLAGMERQPRLRVSTAMYAPLMGLMSGGHTVGLVHVMGGFAAFVAPILACITASIIVVSSGWQRVVGVHEKARACARASSGFRIPEVASV